MTNKKLRAAQKAFPATKRNEHLLSTADILALPTGDGVTTGISVPAPITAFEHKGKAYVIRTEGKADSYGIGKVVSPGVATFGPGFYGLKRAVLATKIAGFRSEPIERAEFQLKVRDAGRN